MARLLRWIYNLIVMSLLVVIISQLLLPLAAERAAHQLLKQRFPEAAEVSAQFRSFPAVKMLWGRMDSFSLRVRGLSLNQIPVNLLAVEGSGVRWEVDHLLQGKLGWPAEGAVRLDLLLSQDDINILLSRWVMTGFASPRMVLTGSTAVLAGEVRLLGQVLPVQVTGKFGAQGGEVWYQPEQVLLKDQRLGAEFSRDLTRGLTFKLPLGELPEGITLKSVQVQEQQLLLSLVVNGDGSWCGRARSRELTGENPVW